MPFADLLSLEPPVETRLPTLTTETTKSSRIQPLEIELLLHLQSITILLINIWIPPLPLILQQVVPHLPRPRPPPQLLPLPSQPNLFPPPPPPITPSPSLPPQTSTKPTTTSTLNPKPPSGQTSYRLRRISASKGSSSSRTTCVSSAIRCEEEDRTDCGRSETRERCLRRLEEQDRSWVARLGEGGGRGRE